MLFSILDEGFCGVAAPAGFLLLDGEWDVWDDAYDISGWDKHCRVCGEVSSVQRVRCWGGVRGLCGLRCVVCGV